jgi:hypothetical protein
VRDGGACVTAALTCPPGYYLLAGVCQKCGEYCTVCVNSDACSTCLASYVVFEGRCLPGCPTNTYSQNTVCINCHSSCAMCNGPADSNCLLCLPGKFLVSSKCYDSCPTSTCLVCPASFYFQASTISCVRCTDGCLVCNSAACVTCSAGYTLSSGACVPNCLDGQFVD